MTLYFGHRLSIDVVLSITEWMVLSLPFGVDLSSFTTGTLLGIGSYNIAVLEAITETHYLIALLPVRCSLMSLYPLFRDFQSA